MFREGVWRVWWHDRDPRVASDVEEDIDDELHFHVQSLIDENLANGMSRHDAEADARDRFGCVDRYAQACRWIDLGDRIMLQRFLAVGLILVGLLVGLLYREVRELRRSESRDQARQQRIHQQMAAMQVNLHQLAGNTNLPAEPELCDLQGQVVDADHQPLADVDVLIILKTWPNGRYRQEDHSATTDQDGRFRLKNLIPYAQKHAILLAAVRDGYAFQSIYDLKPRGSSKPVDPIPFELAKAAPVTLTIQDEHGRPVPHATVAPSRRISSEGKEHLVYFQGSDPVHRTSNDEGRVGIQWFAAGDRAKLHLRAPGKDWDRYSVNISAARDAVVVSVPSPVE